MINLSKIRETLNKSKGKKELLEQTLINKTRELNLLQSDLKHTERAKAILIQAAMDTQKELEVHISSIVSAALKTVFEESYDFVLEFVERRGKTEADLYFMYEGNRLEPFTDTGLGVVDITSCVLRIACWGMSRNKYRNILLLDEPFKHLSSDLQTRAAYMLKKLSLDTGIQIIYITHVSNAKGIIKNADRVFKTSKINGVSQIRGYLPEQYLNRA